MKNLITLLFAVSMLSLPFTVQAQSIFSTHLQYNHQGSALHEQGFQNGGGFGSAFLFPSISKNPAGLQVRPGIRFDIAWNGSVETPKVVTDLDDGTPYDIGVRNFNTGLYSSLRVSKEVGNIFSVYADGLLGARLFISKEYITSLIADDACPKLDLPVLASDLNLSWGGSMGMTVDLNSEISLDIRGTYLRNGPISFVNLNTVVPGKDLEPYDYSLGTAQANQFMLEVGVQFLLFCY